MLNSIQSYIINLPVPLWLQVLLSGMIPLVEARYAILFFMDSGMPYWQLFTLGIVGNMIPIPFIIYFFRTFLQYLLKTKSLAKLGKRLEERTIKKANSIKKISILGLFIFVALPIPGTGAISGAMVAAILNMREKHALPVIFLGAIVATLITTGSMSFIMRCIEFFQYSN